MKIGNMSKVTINQALGIISKVLAPLGDRINFYKKFGECKDCMFCDNGSVFNERYYAKCKCWLAMNGIRDSGVPMYIDLHFGCKYFIKRR
jgi:hypothetical protein